MEYKELLRALEVIHVKLADSNAYNELLEQKLNFAVEAVENCIKYPNSYKYLPTLRKCLKKLEREAIDAHGASKVSRQESKFARWRKQVEKELN